MRRKKTFIIVLNLFFVTYFEIRTKAYNLLLAFFVKVRKMFVESEFIID